MYWQKGNGMVRVGADLVAASWLVGIRGSQLVSVLVSFLTGIVVVGTLCG
jgi:hypothetical protein